MARNGKPADDGKIPPKVLAKRTLEEFKKDDVPEIAAGVAYHSIFAIPPMIAFVVALAALLNQVFDVPVAERLTRMIEENAPGETRQLLLDLVNSSVQEVSGGAALFGVLLTAAIALWSGSNGVATLMKASNRAYDVSEDRSFIRKKLVAIGLTVVLGVLVILAFAMLVFGRQIGEAIASWLGLGSVWDITWSIVQFAGPVVFIGIVLALLYYFAPNVKQSFRWISPGSIFATVTWIAVLIGFRFYLQLSDPGSAYGTVGSVVVLMFFLYVSAIVFIVGAEINAIIGRSYDPETVRDLAHNLGKLEGPLDELAVRQAARQMDLRDGTNITDGMATPILAPPPEQRQSVEPGRSAKEQAEKKQKEKPGFLARMATSLSTFAAGLLLARFKKSREKKRQ